ncbi:MAG: GTP cyclohydrolase I FolE [Candidatus Protochlamydia sp.]|nr:GTP cyclohydrolase I FolE [Candidatus Protochlamydia sp.]
MFDFEEMENDRKAIQIAEHISQILTLIGEDVNREGLLKTPTRVAKVLEYLTMGSSQEREVEVLLSSALYTHEYNEMVLIKDIEFYSLCEHHMLPFFGRAHIAYMPDGKVIGLSKIPRLVDLYARRLQIQERMTMQIKDALQKHLEPKGVAVLIQASHMCMMVRGVQKQQSTTVTSALSGEFLTDFKTREEFMHLVSGKL